MSVLDQIGGDSAGGDAVRKAPHPKRKARQVEQMPRKGPSVPRDERGRLLPGLSLNPGGRPVGVAARAREILEQSNAWEFLEDVAAGRADVEDKLRVEVIKMLADRGYGKSPAIQLTAELPPETASQLVPLQELPAEMVEEELALRRKQRAWLDAKEGAVDAEIVAPALPTGTVPAIDATVVDSVTAALPGGVSPASEPSPPSGSESGE